MECWRALALNSDSRRPIAATHELCNPSDSTSNHWRASRPNEEFDKSPKESFGQIPTWFTPFTNLFSSSDIPLMHVPLDDYGGNYLLSRGVRLSRINHLSAEM